MADDVYGEPPSAAEIAALASVLALSVERMVRNRCRRTIVENAQEDPAKPKCRWVVEPDACDFCVQRGSFLYDPSVAPVSSHNGCKCHTDTSYNPLADRYKKETGSKGGLKRAEVLSNEGFFTEHRTPIGGISVNSRQFGHKSEYHMKDFDLDNNSSDHRLEFRGIVYDILTRPDEIRDGLWHDTGEYPAWFFIRGYDAIIVKQETRSYVSILKGATDVDNRPNKRVQSARTIYKRS